ncbi:hypothetical protein ALC56_06720 [Trachymyrmex septentrionalis]|uniref:Uncharacterized protein n=1 Tax=Trachymyrmex septentrionalis TaxID=34720 RepID=A0A195FEB6_9HYME|nr:hypothetical protein ALC56_06720 [Trachymyrmex septentrionalis]
MSGFGRHTSKVIAYLRDQVGPSNNNGEVSDGVHPISVAAAAGHSASNGRAKCPQQYGKNMSYIINVRDGQDAHYLIANIYSSTFHFVEWLPSSVTTLPWLKGYDIIETLLGEGSENDGGKASGKLNLKISNVHFCFTNNTVFNRRGARRACSAKYTRLVRARPPGRLIASTAAFRFARETPNGYYGRAGLRARARLISQSEPKNSGAIKWTAACTRTVLPVFGRKSRIAKCNPTVRACSQYANGEETEKERYGDKRAYTFVLVMRYTPMAAAGPLYFLPIGPTWRAASKSCERDSEHRPPALKRVTVLVPVTHRRFRCLYAPLVV